MDKVSLANSVTAGVQSASNLSSSPTPDQRALTQAVSGAVQKLNKSGIAGEGREITFSVDPGTRIPVVKVVDTNTNEVINQWPPEYALRLAEEHA
jgi:uncharacterized FlaG/YvyC family protein